jgi:hypothetical protein
VNVPEDVDEGILNDILGVAGILKEQEGKAKRAGVVPLVQRPLRTFVSGDSLGDGL